MHSIPIRSLGRCVLSFNLCITFLLALNSPRLQAQEPVKPSDPGTAEERVPDAPHAAEPTNERNLFQRWGRFYHMDWFPAAIAAGAASAPAPARRGLPSPLDSPPFPNADWSYGGAPVIGEPDTGTYPLMTAAHGDKPGGLPRTKVYGWLEPSLNFSTSAKSNAPVANDVYSNRFELSQAVVYIERLPDTVQRDHFDWGFHLTGLYGADYRFTTGKGYFSHQWLGLHRQYGFDPALEYLDLYLPRIGQGTNIRIGRYISIPGVEAQLAPNNYIFSHSLLYSIDPFTDTGVLATTKINDQWLVQVGLSGGHDVALWTKDAKPSLTACVSYTTQSVNDNFYVCANGINDAKYAFNNIQQYDATWYHRFSKTLHVASETWYMYERSVPAVGGPVKTEPGANGAYCFAGETRCTAPEYAADASLQKELSLHDYLAIRGDFLDDKKGQRTGYATRYGEATVMWSHWIGTTIQLRPELRFDRAFDRKAYDNGVHHDQFTAASDLIFHF